MLKLLKTDEILRYLDYFKDQPKQNSKEWQETRRLSIGGSEIAIIQGISPFKKLRNMMEAKINNNYWDGNIYTWWGKVFEPIVKSWCELVFHTKIYGTNDYLRNIPNKDGFAYSPDGIGVVQIPIEIEYNNSILRRYVEDKIVLFEFKSPFGKMVKENVPEDHYVSQVKMGLDMIDIAEMGLLVEAVFRRCSWNDLDFTTNYDHEFQTKSYNETVSAFGIIYICVHDISDINLNNLKAIYKENYLNIDETVDYGTCDRLVLEEILRLITKGHILPVYSHITISNQEMSLRKLEKIYEDLTSSAHVIGVLPWKLVDIVYHPIEKTIGYLDQYKEKISEILKVIKDGQNNMANSKNILDKYFNIPASPDKEVEDNFVYV